ncbi:hypothetical protein SpCBS45565_g06735 [Spizellomyces sp. 'palustris']|nr:hypothetical protein SpCBS45565_g06735 [Spizellomyces sp. 'palustris']
MGVIHDKAKAGDLEGIQAHVNDPETASEASAERDLHENTVLHIACKYGHELIVDWALEQPNVQVDALNVAGDTALILAASKGRLGVVKKLVSRGANVNHANDHGNTALHYACFWRHKEVAVYLAQDAGAHVAIKNKYQRTPLLRTSEEIKEALKAEAAVARTVQSNARTFAQAKEEAKQRFLAKGGIDWEITATSVQTTPTPLSRSRHFLTRRGRWNNYDVIIKTPLDQTNIISDDLGTLISEIATIRKLFHPNLLVILGACVVPPNIGVLTEVVPYGDAWTFLHDASVDMSPEVAMGMAVGVCRGMAFLHEQDPPILHGNLKSQNVMLMDDGTVKLTDYGLTSPIYNPRATLSNRYLSNAEWLAPEILRGYDPTINRKAVDVYAFGMMLHEIVTRGWPYEDMNSMHVGMRVLLENMRPEIPGYVPGNLAQLMTMCWALEPSSRPSFTSALEILLSTQI